MRLTTPAFVPPPVVPFVPGATNAIVQTGGLLTGALGGAKAGAVFGPAGAAAGALGGAALALLVFAPPTNPGTLPKLDPGLNDPEPSPQPERNPVPDIPLTRLPAPPGKEGQVLTWTVTYLINEYRAAKFLCPPLGGGAQIRDEIPTRTSDPKTVSYNAETIGIELLEGYNRSACGENQIIENVQVYNLNINLFGGDSDGQIDRENRVNRVQKTERAQNGLGDSEWVEIAAITADELPVPNPFPQPETPKKPRPTPFPFEPVPSPEPEPEKYPVREPEPEREPLSPPSPNNPDAPPITVPKPSPPKPQTAPKPTPFPVPGPFKPVTPQPPFPAPDVPPVKEPTPDPNTAPAPGPAPRPTPGPEPEPRPQPAPPAPRPLPIPPLVLPTNPAVTQPTTLEGGVQPIPAPPVVSTPADMHFPVPGGQPVTSGGTRPSPNAIAAEIGRIEQKAAQGLRGQKGLLDNLGDLTDLLVLLNLLKDLFEQPMPSKEYSITGVCEQDPDTGENPSTSVILPPEMWADRVISSIDMLPDLLQAHLGYKTPICAPAKPVLEGDFRTISFRSDEVSPYGKSRLRKRFRYRSTSSLGLAEVVDHWKDFTFNAGSVCVQHAGSPWGTPQVWAATADEGKRVIRHAAGESGFDPDQDGRWIVGGSNSPRFGVPGTMRVDTKGGYYWITARDGSDQRPIVALT